MNPGETNLGVDRRIEISLEPAADGSPRVLVVVVPHGVEVTAVDVLELLVRMVKQKGQV